MSIRDRVPAELEWCVLYCEKDRQSLLSSGLCYSVSSSSSHGWSFFIYRTNVLFAFKEPSKVPPGRPKEGPKEPAWKKEVREAREKKQHTEPDKVWCMIEREMYFWHFFPSNSNYTKSNTRHSMRIAYWGCVSQPSVSMCPNVTSQIELMVQNLCDARYEKPLKNILLV